MPANKTILLVEDDMITAAVESAMLKKNGFDVIIAPSGENAVEIVRYRAVDLILMDIDLGHGLSGPETAELILRISSIPIVFLTSHSEKEMVDKVSTITRFGYVIKNSGDFVLLSSIKMAFELNNAFKKLEESNTELKLLNDELNNTNAEIIKTNLRLMQYQSNLEMSEEKFRQLFENMTEGVAIHEMYYNDRGNAVDYRILSVNKSFEKHTGIPLFKATDMLASRLYGTNCAPYIREYENVTKTGIPAVFDTYFEKMQKHFHIGVISLGGPYFATIFEDITQHIKSGEKIIESERKYRSLYEYSQVGFFETDLDNAKIIMCNPRYCEMAGFSSVDEAIGHDILHLYVDPGARDEIKKIMRMQGYITNHVIKLRNRKTGKIFWGEFSARLGTNGNTAVGSIIDITDLKLAEEELRFKNEKLQTAMEELESINRELSSAMEELESANEELIKTNTRLVQHQREKDILLQEVHHRIKNNMNTISNLLFLQSEKLSDKSAAGALDDARIRIQSMMIIYDRLYRSSDYKNISIKMYLNNLIDEIFSVFPISEKINIEKQLEDFIMNSNSLFHIGIIVNEIITNSFKYAFPGQAKGVLIIRAFKIDDNTAEIAISDNGIGLYNPDYSRKKTGFGLDLIMMLAEQMNAMVELDGHNGTSFRIRFMLN